MNFSKTCRFPEWCKRPMRGCVEKRKQRPRAGPLFAWVSRFFVVDDGHVSYYRSPEDAAGGLEPAFRVHVREIVNVRSISSGGAGEGEGWSARRLSRGGGVPRVRAGHFEVVTTERRFLLRSPNEEEADRWLLAIQYRVWQHQRREKQKQDALTDRWRRHAHLREAQSDMAMDKLMSSTRAGVDMRRASATVFTTGVFAREEPAAAAAAAAAEKSASPPPRGLSATRQFRVAAPAGEAAARHRIPSPPPPLSPRPVDSALYK